MAGAPGRSNGIVRDRAVRRRRVRTHEEKLALFAGIVVGDVASRGLVTVDPEQDLDEALALMARHQVRRLPVVEQDRLVGIAAQADVAHGVKAKQAGEVVEEISKPTGVES
jgi:CBS domain-containing protein